MTAPTWLRSAATAVLWCCLVGLTLAAFVYLATERWSRWFVVTLLLLAAACCLVLALFDPPVHDEQT
jgi:peptidoglycan/LPS O-acetylase OafA/YrhL